MGMIEFDEDEILAANVNGDSDVTIGDALMILRFTMGMITEF